MLNKYSFEFEAERQGFPNLSFEATMAGWEMAKNYAGKLLQSDANTMFVSVRVIEWVPSSSLTGEEFPGRIVQIDLCTTRGVKEGDEYVEPRF